VTKPSRRFLFVVVSRDLARRLIRLFRERGETDLHPPATRPLRRRGRVVDLGWATGGGGGGGGNLACSVCFCCFATPHARWLSFSFRCVWFCSWLSCVWPCMSPSPLPPPPLLRDSPQRLPWSLFSSCFFFGGVAATQLGGDFHLALRTRNRRGMLGCLFAFSPRFVLLVPFPLPTT